MSQRIRDRIDEHNRRCGWIISDQSREKNSLDLLDFILSEIAEAEKRGHDSLSRLAYQIAVELETVKRNQRQIMITNDIIEKTISRAETDVHNLIAALPGNQTPSTPDTVVTSLLGRLDGISTAAEAALAGTGTPTPAPVPTGG